MSCSMGVANPKLAVCLPTAASCDHCSNGSAPYALGVSVKCVCQKESAPYCWALGFEAKHFKYAMEQEDLRVRGPLPGAGLTMCTRAAAGQQQLQLFSTDR
jgi:hypothetical protein